ncbi:hypothetical protein K4B79_18790 [Streptomyces lincolnensis]|uniref:hypothetical protein n=1 Tax=Streptomyces lincolnensis TaxID=1915 RepID=UPI001E4D4EA0|nr:hypothetical protein [Streptomyces lincolnensis]MCD7440263.1 hypothetical protein [Streptomyces lincolnensis]
MHLRQVTACPCPAAFTSFRRRRKDGLAWQIFTCQKHRRINDWSVPGNLRRLEVGEGEYQCGTVHDFRPMGEIIVSHVRGWMGGECSLGDSPGIPDDDWRGQLRNVRVHLAYIEHRRLLAIVDRALRIAETGELNDVVALLAEAEADGARRRGL